MRRPLPVLVQAQAGRWPLRRGGTVKRNGGVGATALAVELV